jgi:hypothetical protein
MYKRHYFKWNINELIALQREYELLELTIQEIAIKHNRSVKAILCKLEQENFIKNWNEAKGFDEYVECNRELDYYLRSIDDDTCDTDDADDTSDDEVDLMEKNYSDLSSIKKDEQSEKNYIISQLNNIRLLRSVKQLFHHFSHIVNKFTNITSNNSSSDNLCEM